MATKGERIGAWVVGGAVFSAVVGAIFWWWPNGDDDRADKKKADEKKADYKKKKADEKKAEKRRVYKASVKRCGGVPYNAAQWPDPKSVAVGLSKLGFAVSNVESVGGRGVVRAFQTWARTWELNGMKGKSDAWIDGVVGPCTLRSLSHATLLQEQGERPPVP